jgi:chromosome segregation ATPase
MAEETNVPSEPGGRRSRQDSDKESGGGKVFIIFLAVLLVVALFLLYKRHTGASAQAKTDADSIASLSNQVAELRTKMMLEHSDTSLAKSNQQALLDRRTAELTATSNRLVQTTLLLNNAQQDLRSAQDTLAAKISSVATLEARRDELDRQAAVIPGLQREVAELKEKLVDAQFTEVALEESLSLARLELADLRRAFDDPEFLRLQAKRAEDAAETNRRLASKQRIDVSDPRVRLELQPDGTVRPWIATNHPARK